MDSMNERDRRVALKKIVSLSEYEEELRKSFKSVMTMLARCKSQDVTLLEFECLDGILNDCLGTLQSLCLDIESITETSHAHKESFAGKTAEIVTRQKATEDGARKIYKATFRDKVIAETMERLEKEYVDIFEKSQEVDYGF